MKARHFKKMRKRIQDKKYLARKINEAWDKAFYTKVKEFNKQYFQ